MGETFLPALTVERFSQITDCGFQEGIVVKEKVRAMESHVKHPAKPLNTLSVPGIQQGKDLLAKPVVGIMGGHKITSRSDGILFYSTPKIRK
jgi:hypothetical protein